MPVLHEPQNLGDLLKYEAPNLYSRDRVTLAAGENLSLGTVLGQVKASGQVRQLDPAASDGTQIAVGVLIQDCDARAGERSDGLMVARHAILSDRALQWPTALTAVQQQTALSELKALGLLVRPGA